ncbi:MAG TPA: sulfatase-like hydrolase/transferase [Ferruginibacter sp.]|nr:sulfatase-like hydrolase/transferase [Ferruginibacter sp.]
MKYLSFSGKNVWQNNKPVIWFLLGLLLILSVLKIIFYNYNYILLFTGGEEISTGYAKIKLAKWSLINDLLVVLLINIPFLLLLQMVRMVPAKLFTWFIMPVFFLLNSFVVLLNLTDIFYFPFHFQRANADLLYVLEHPFKQIFHFNIFIIILFITALTALLILIWKLHTRLLNGFLKGSRAVLLTTIIITCVAVCLLFPKSLGKILVPTYPLVEIKSRQLPAVQNSFHTFSYSLFRKGEEVRPQHYFSKTEADAFFPLRKKLQLSNVSSGKKNIVLFIMESVPYDFFDTASAYKVQMPFFDSLLQYSSFYKNAFCYAHESNKGVTSILAGIPTLSDIPVYHSRFISIPITAVGAALKKNNYSSFFCIGDEFDNFGFAKCMNWLGIAKYYSKEDIPGYKNKPAHTMGLHDETVLGFMQEKIKEVQQPFFAVNYNISTHYPYDLPGSFSLKFPASYTDPMKSMRYYDHCLQQFFLKAKNESWFANTVFIFCSDHWMFPQGIKGEYDPFSGYRIPVIIYDPAVNQKKISEQMVSQFDIMGTILAVGGYKDSIISYGGNLLDSSSLRKYVFSRPNSSLYQVSDSTHVLGFNITNGKVEYLYNYKSNIKPAENLSTNKNSTAILNELTIQAKAFIQKASLHYTGTPIK